MVESDNSKFTPPFSSNKDTVENGHNVVTKQLPAVETFGWYFPYAIDTVDPIRFSENVIEMQSLEGNKDT